MLIIGITGTIGSGKGTVVEYLTKNKNFLHYPVKDFVTKEIKKRKLKVNRESMRIVANELRKKNYPSYIVDSLYESAKKDGRNAIIESLRNIGEVKSLQQKGNFFLFAVDADPKLRFKRIKLRKSEKDNVTYKEFLEGERKEMQNTDPNKQNLKKCIDMADFRFENNGTIEELYGKVEKVLDEINSFDEIISFDEIE